MAGDQHRVQAKQEELGGGQGVGAGIDLAPRSPEFDGLDHKRHDGVLGPLVGPGQQFRAPRREVQPEHLPEEHLPDAPLDGHEQPDDLRQRTRKVVRCGEEPG